MAGGAIDVFLLGQLRLLRQVRPRPAVSGPCLVLSLGHAMHGSCRPPFIKH